MLEGAATLAMAGYLQERERYRDRHVAIVLCGASLVISSLAEILDRG